MAYMIKPRSKLEIDVKEHGNRVFFEVQNDQTSRHGYSVVEICTMGPSVPYAKLSPFLKMMETYGRLEQFYPNGKTASDDEMRQGRGIQMLDYIIAYLKAKQIRALFCHTTSKTMQSFLFKKTLFEDLDDGDYLLLPLEMVVTPRNI